MSVMRKTGILMIALSVLCASSAEADSPLVLTPKDRIIFFGDSLTEMGEGPGGYVSSVRNILVNRFPGIEIIGAGISGDRVADLLDRVERDVLSKKPSIVVVFIGTNDVWSNNGLFGGVTVEAFRRDLDSLTDQLSKSGARVALATLAVIGERVPPANPLDALMESFSSAIREIATRRALPICDLRSRFRKELTAKNRSGLDQGVFTTDGVHFNRAGNDLVADEMVRLFVSPD